MQLQNWNLLYKLRHSNCACASNILFWLFLFYKIGHLIIQGIDGYKKIICKSYLRAIK